MITLLIIKSLVGGWVSRMCGGAPPKLPWGLDQFVFSLPYLIFFPVIGIWQSVLSYAGAVLGKRLGHGNGMDLSYSKTRGNPEKVEKVILWLHGKISEYWYDFLTLALTSLVANLILGGFLIFTNPLIGGWFLVLSTLCKPVAYSIGWKIYPNFTGKGIKNLNEATQIGEFLTGFFQYLLIFSAHLLI